MLQEYNFPTGFRERFEDWEAEEDGRARFEDRMDAEAKRQLHRDFTIGELIKDRLDDRTAGMGDREQD